MRVDYQGLSKAQQLGVVMVLKMLLKEVKDVELPIETLLSTYEKLFGIAFELTKDGWKAYVTNDVKLDSHINTMINKRL